MHWSGKKAEFVAKMFAYPITVREYVEKTGIVPVTGRKAVETWVRAGTLFEAGRVRSGGRKAMRYCSDPEVARVATLEAEESSLRLPTPKPIFPDVCHRCAQVEAALRTLGYVRLGPPHPDSGGTHEKMIEINSAYETLRDR